MKELLKQLRESAEFQQIMQQMKHERPIVSDYYPGKTFDENQFAVEQMKFSSAQRQGFDKLYRLLTGESP